MHEQPTSNAQRLRKYSAGVKTDLKEIKAAVSSLVQQVNHLETLITTSVSADRPADQREQQQDARK
jgi:hypothetical protein